MSPSWDPSPSSDFTAQDGGKLEGTHFGAVITVQGDSCGAQLVKELGDLTGKHPRILDEVSSQKDLLD